MKRLIFFLVLGVCCAVPAMAQESLMSPGELKEMYLSKRARFMDSSTKKFSEAEQAELNGLLEDIRTVGPTSFEYYLVSYINGNYNTDLKDHLINAYTLNPDDELVNRELLGYYIITDNLAKQKEFARRIYKTYTAAELDYYRDAMPTGPGILLASNQEDMYAFFVVQLIDGIGTEVKIVNLDFLKNTSYKAAVSSHAGVTDGSFLGSESTYLKTLITGSSRKVYVSTTLNQAYLSQVENNMVLTGLVYQYGTVDQRTLLDNFWNRMKSKDLSTFAASVSAEQKLYSNYLPPLLTLYKLKKMEGTEDITLKTTIQTIAEKTGKKDAVNQILQSYASDE